jgi:quinol monooxygenase YgiN
MIIVTGSIVARADTFDRVLALSREHVERSRAEPGCLSHAVYRDVENPLRLVFFEEWADRKALAKHFSVPASGEFVTSAGALAAETPTLRIYEATPAS